MNQVIEFFAKLFGTESWPPRWQCGTWTDFHGWLYIISDLLIWGAYFIIPIVLVKFVIQKRDVPLPRVFWLFGAFIVLCGATHLIDAMIFWWPAYRFSAFVRFLTACVSWFTVFALIKILPQAFAMKTHKEFEREICDRRKAEKKAIAYSVELKRKNKELEQFAYVASHDLQEPLRTISNFVGLIEEKYSETNDVDTEQHLKFIVNASTKMQNLIKELLQLSRIGTNISFSTIDCNNIVDDVITDLEVSMNESNAQIRTSQLPVLEGNEMELKRLFLNLISNAIKFRKEDITPVIEIAVEERNTEWLFSIKDNGIGIEEKYQEKIFIIFQRLHAVDMYGGTVIGLASCKKIVSLHDGKIWIESSLGEGSTFYFTISKHLINLTDEEG